MHNYASSYPKYLIHYVYFPFQNINKSIILLFWLFLSHHHMKYL